VLGEGGMIPDERRYSMKWFYQCIQSRYGFNPHHLRLADACEFFIGQGCKVGLGGHLMGQKVTDQVAEMRSLPAGIDQRSPARHPDWLGPDDLALKIEEMREATNWEIPIQLKLGAARVYDDVRMAVKCGPDSIYIDAMEGGTGAGPISLPRIPACPALPPSARLGVPSTSSASAVRSASSMPAASGTAATWQRPWRSAPMRLPSGTRC
jgi:glutamate synthase domain-containing protein 2